MSLLHKSSDFDNFKHAIEKQLSLEVQKREEMETKLDEIAFKSEAANAEIFTLKEQLDLEKKEKDAIEVELRKRESEFISEELKYKTEMACKIKELQVRAEEQAKHLEETLRTKHKEEISCILCGHQLWKEEKEAKHLKEVQDYKNEAARKLEEREIWLKELEGETLNLKRRIEQIESGRSQMLSQLRSFLQSMWRNSFQLFYGTHDQDAELLQEEHHLERCLHMPPSSAQEFYSIPKNTRRCTSLSLPLNLTSSADLSHDCYTENAYSSSMKKTEQLRNVHHSKTSLESPVILSESGGKYLTNRENLISLEDQLRYGSNDPMAHDNRTKLLPGRSQMHCCADQKDGCFPEQWSSISCCSDYHQTKSDNKLQNKVPTQDILYRPINSTGNNVTVDFEPIKKAKNAVHFVVPCKESVNNSNNSEEGNMLCSDVYSERGSSSTEMMNLPTPTSGSKHVPPLVIHKMYCHQMPAEKLETHSKPLTKEVVTADPALEIQNGSFSEETEEQALKVETQTEPPTLYRKMSCTRKSEHCKDRKLAKKDPPSNYLIKDLRAIYCPETRYDADKHSTRTGPMNWELYNRFHPWK